MNPTQLTGYAKTYAPEVHLYPADANPYDPCSADWYLDNVNLVIPATKTTYRPPINRSDLPTTVCTDQPAPYLEIPDPAVRNGKLNTAVAYCHIVNVPNVPDTYDLQYWMFYAIRGLSTLRLQVVASGTEYDQDLLAPADSGYAGLGEHQGDWKHATVRIDEQGQVQGVFYGQHTGGFWLPARCVPVNDQGQPIVYSAHNTHSCFPVPGKYNQEGSTFTIHGYLTASLLEDAAEDGPVWNCAKDLLVVDGDIPSWITYAGQWGPTFEEHIDVATAENILNDILPHLPSTLKQQVENDRSDVLNDLISMLTRVLGHEQSGPSTPSYQDPWTKGDGGSPTATSLP